MSRILRRPMFRMGGTPNEGIMTGLKQPRKGYEEGSTVEEPGYFDKAGLGILLKGAGTEGRKIGAATYDLAGVPLNALSRFLIGENPGFSGARVFGLGEEEGIDPDTAQFLGITTKAKPTGFFADKEINLGGSAKAEEPDKKGTSPSKKDPPPPPAEKTPSDLDTYKDILNLYKSELSASDDELKRQRFLELAKFGANLAAQPGGSLTQAIGSSAAKSLEGLTRIEEAKRKQDQTAKALALETAIKQLEPGTIAKQVRDIKRLNPKLSDVEALDKVISGTATKGRTQETRISTYANDLYEDDIVSSKTAGRKAAEAIEESGYGIGRFNKDPGEGDREIGTYYILKDGRIGKYKGKDKTGKEDFSSPGDEDF